MTWISSELIHGDQNLMGKTKCNFCGGTGQIIEPSGTDFKTVVCRACGGTGQG